MNCKKNNYDMDLEIELAFKLNDKTIKSEFLLGFNISKDDIEIVYYEDYNDIPELVGIDLIENEAFYNVAYSHIMNSKFLDIHENRIEAGYFEFTEEDYRYMKIGA